MVAISRSTLFGERDRFEFLGAGDGKHVGSEVAIRSPCLAEAIRTASASEIGREER
jgi:hypothetical protein